MNVYPQFQYYDSDAESEGSNNDQEFYRNGDVGVVSPGPGWSKDYGNKNFGQCFHFICGENFIFICFKLIILCCHTRKSITDALSLPGDVN